MFIRLVCNKYIIRLSVQSQSIRALPISLFDAVSLRTLGAPPIHFLQCPHVLYRVEMNQELALVPKAQDQVA